MQELISNLLACMQCCTNQKYNDLQTVVAELSQLSLNI